jgi:hypothetical protein
MPRSTYLEMPSAGGRCGLSIRAAFDLCFSPTVRSDKSGERDGCSGDRGDEQHTELGPAERGEEHEESFRIGLLNHEGHSCRLLSEASANLVLDRLGCDHGRFDLLLLV